MPVKFPRPRRGIVIAFVWKQTPFALLVAGAMASINRDTIEAALQSRRLEYGDCCSRSSCRRSASLTIGLILSFVTMMSVLSVPLMINAQS